MKSLVFTVTNDLNYDQRMERICGTLAANGYVVTLVGRKRRNSAPLKTMEYTQRRIPCFFDKGKLFYLEYNFKLICFLLFRSFHTVCAIDLDSILPAFLVSKIRRKVLIYDAHEYFTEMEEIVRRPLIKSAWTALERFTIPRVKHAYTISEGYAKMYKAAYNREFEVIRNVPRKSTVEVVESDSQNRIIQYQGALNMGRGLEEAIEAISELDGFTLRIFGDGPLSKDLKKLTKALKAEDKIEFMGLFNPVELRTQTQKAWVGLCLFSETGLHHRYSLGIRFFDYFHAEVPQIAMDFPEYQSFNAQHRVASLIPILNKESLKSAILELSENTEKYAELKVNCAKAREDNCWEKESIKLLSFYSKI
jgi:glycosyltransferase involved in cell wall biosynthesis